MFCGYCDSKLKEWKGIQESSFGVTAAGKRYKRWGRGWKVLRKSSVYITKDQWDGDIQKVLGHRERMSVLRKQVVKVLVGSEYVLFDAPSVETSGWPKMIWSCMFLCQILLTDLISELIPMEKLQEEYAIHQTVWHIRDCLILKACSNLDGSFILQCNCHFQLVKCLRRYFHEINMQADMQKKFPCFRECHIPLEF